MLLLLAAQLASAALDPARVHVADNRKKAAWVRDGLVTGGDRGVSDVVVKDIRRGPNPGFERVVIEIEGNSAGEPLVIARPPYFQVAVSPDEKRLVFTVWGKPKIGFDPRKVSRGFLKSPVISRIELLPRVEDDIWTFVLELKRGTPVEVFELSDPVRVVLDIKTR